MIEPSTINLCNHVRRPGLVDDNADSGEFLTVIDDEGKKFQAGHRVAWISNSLGKGEHPNEDAYSVRQRMSLWMFITRSVTEKSCHFLEVKTRIPRCPKPFWHVYFVCEHDTDAPSCFEHANP